MERDNSYLATSISGATFARQLGLGTKVRLRCRFNRISLHDLGRCCIVFPKATRKRILGSRTPITDVRSTGRSRGRRMEQPSTPDDNAFQIELNSFSQAQSAAAHAVRYVANSEFNQAVLFFKDGSYLQFEHKGRESRWAKASAERTQAERACLSMSHFRLNALHLQLYFEDGSDVEFTL